jgi:alkylation response protein AidB-like acyl-CoA dehydrogenase
MTTRFLAELVLGRLRWDLLCPFPVQDQQDQLAGDQFVDGIGKFLAHRLDRTPADELPHRFCDDLRGSDYLRLQVPVVDGGPGLSDFNTFRAISAVMTTSVAAGFVLATHNGIGLPALLPVLPDGPVRDLVLSRISDGVISGWADTEPAGAANRRLSTEAVLADDGYLISGEKVFISNGPIADELIVGATISGTDDVGLFVVDTRQAGFTVRAAQEVIGLRGLPLGALVLDRVYVPPDRMILSPGQHWRDLPLLEPISARGRMYLISAAALAIATRCLGFQQHFASRRSVDGVPLADYPAVQELIATSMADVFAMDTVARWCLLGSDEANLTDRYLERHAAKNISSLTCWRVADRTMSLLAAEGAETSSSKRRRGAPALPVEQLFRDARILRITGGVDFNVALRGARLALAHWYASQPTGIAVPDMAASYATRLSARNREHLAATTAAVDTFARTCRSLIHRHPDQADLFGRELTLIALGRIMHELLTQAVVLGRVATENANDDTDRQALADIYCTNARNRLSGLWRDLDQANPEPYQHVTAQWLSSASGNRWHPTCE